MICDERRDAVYLYAFGELEPSEADELRGHLETGCPQCAGALAEAQALLASMSLALPPIAPDPAIKQRLMAGLNARADAPERRASGAAADVLPRRFTTWAVLGYSGLAAAVAAAVTGVVVWSNARGTIDRLVGERDILFAERMQMVSLGDPDGKTPASGRVYWDLDRGQWRVVVFNLKPLPPGKAYQLWAIPDGGAPIPMDTFTVDAQGSGTLVQAVPASAAALKVAAITMEPVGGSKTPTMPIHLAGEVK